MLIQELYKNNLSFVNEVCEAFSPSGPMVTEDDVRSIEEMMKGAIVV